MSTTHPHTHEMRFRQRTGAPMPPPPVADARFVSEELLDALEAALEQLDDYAEADRPQNPALAASAAAVIERARSAIDAFIHFEFRHGAHR